jgi:hypothetical protein
MTDWPALQVEEWSSTREMLHSLTQIVGKVRMCAEPMVNHWWQATLYVSVRGLSTGVIHAGDQALELELDLVEHILCIRTPDRAQPVPIRSGSVAELYQQIEQAITELGLEVRIWPVPREVQVAVPFTEDRKVRLYSPEHADLFWQQLLVADRLLKRFRSEFAGKVSPVHFFWGSFDMAVTRFSGRPAPTHPGGTPNCADWVMVEAYSHELTSCGFWPGGGDEGAFYAYAYPEPPGYPETDVGEDAFYYPDGRQFLYPYERVRAASDPDAALLTFLRTTHSAAARLGDWDPSLDYHTRALV